MRQNAVLENSKEVILVRQVIEEWELEGAVDRLAWLNASRHDVPLISSKSLLLGQTV